MSQPQRERAIGAFRNGTARILVATDVAARGIDVPEISHIVNYDLPDGADTYIHRVGRTARMGRTGRAFTFVQSDQVRDFKSIKRSSGAQLPHHEVAGNREDIPRGPDKVQALIAPPEPARRGHGQGHGHGHGRGGPRRQSGGPRRGGPRRSGGGQGGSSGQGGSGGPRRSGGGQGGPRRGGPRRSGGGQSGGGPRRYHARS